MKKFLFFILIALTVTSVSSCSKDDDTKPSFVGFWFIQKEAFFVEGEVVHEELLDECDSQTHFQIRDDNSVTFRKYRACNGYTYQDGTYYPDSDQIILRHEGKEYVYEMEYVNGELLFSNTYTIISNDKKVEETKVHYGKKGESKYDYDNL